MKKELFRNRGAVAVPNAFHFSRRSPLHAVPAQRFQTRCWRRRVWVGRPARCPPASSIRAQGDLTAWLTMQSAANQSPPTKFPANREINREFCSIRPAAAISTPGQPVNSTAFSRIPCATEQGIFTCLSGNFFRGTGKFNQQPGIASLRSDAVIAASSPLAICPLYLP